MRHLRPALVLAAALGAMLIAADARSSDPAPERSQVLQVRRYTADDFRGARLRGMTLADMERYGGSIYLPGDFERLTALGANLARVAVMIERCPRCDHYEFPAAQARYVEGLLEAAARNGFGLVVALQPEPAGDKAEYWTDARLQASIREVWAALAVRFKAAPGIAAFDLINEPVPPGVRTPEAANRAWVPFATTLVRAIRAVDPDRVIVFEPAPWGFPAAFAALEPLPFPGIVYSFHFYHPHELTHQGISGYPLGPAYPSREWDRARLARELEPVRAFAARHNAAVYAGEFSCIRWAPGLSAARYVQDLAGLFNAAGWSWTYLGWRGYHGWDAEIPGDAPRELTAAGAKLYRSPDAPVISALARALRAPAGAAPRTGR
jgi:hypothetical protein